MDYDYLEKHEYGHGAKNIIKGAPKTSFFASPIAKEITIKNKIDVIIGPINVWPDTIKNLKTSFLYKENAPTQFIIPKRLSPILYFLNSTIGTYTHTNIKK